MRFQLTSLIPIGFLSACVSTNAAVLDPTVKYQKICPDGVEIFTSANRVPGDYHEVALLHSKGESGWTDERGMAASQRKKAAELGANGIIIGETKEPNAGTKIIGSILGTGAERKGSAVAIYVPSDSDRVRRACGTGRSGKLALTTGDSVVNTGYSVGTQAPINPPRATVVSTLATDRKGEPPSAVTAVPERVPSSPTVAADSTAYYTSLGTMPPTVDEAALGRDPDLRHEMANTRSAGIATAFFEGRPGILKVAVTEDFRSASSLDYVLTRLLDSYRKHRPFDEPGILELWDGDLLVGQYTESGLIPKH